jgi:hypothetical protein
VRPPRSWWAPLVSEGIFHLQLMRARRALRRARPTIYKSDKRKRGGFLPLHLAFDIPTSCASAPEPSLPLRLCSCLPFLVPPSIRMAPQQPITIIDPPAWERSTATTLSLNLLVSGGQLAVNVDGQPAEWIVPLEREQVPNPPYDYIIIFMRFHEHGFAAPASRFLRGLCYHYGVELQNFTPNAISQAATSVSVCEGFLGIPVNWDLWVHLFRAELHTLPTSELRTRCATRAGGLALVVRSSRREEYIRYTMTSNNADWERGWFYLRNADPGLPLHRQGAPGEGRLLVPRGVSALAPGAAGLTRGRVEEAGGSWAGRGMRPRQPPPPADRPPDGEAAPHLRDERGCGPRRVGGVATATGPLPAVVRGHPGPARHRPQAGAL